MLFFFLIVFTTYHRTLYFVVYLEVFFLSSNNPTYLYRALISTICRSCAEIFSCSPMFIDGVLYFFFLRNSNTRKRKKTSGRRRQQQNEETRERERKQPKTAKHCVEYKWARTYRLRTDRKRWRMTSTTIKRITWVMLWIPHESRALKNYLLKITTRK